MSTTSKQNDNRTDEFRNDAAIIARLEPIEQVAFIRGRLAELEAQAATALLEFYELPADSAAVNRLIWGRYLFTTLRVSDRYEVLS